MSENKDNGKEENKEQENNKIKEKNVLKITTKKGPKSKEVPKDETKFETTDKISPKYVSGLEEENTKLRIHLVLLQIKYGEVTQWLGGLRKWMSDKGLDLQNKGRENEGLLNITDKQFDVKFLQEQVQKGVQEYNSNVK